MLVSLIAQLAQLILSQDAQLLLLVISRILLPPPLMHVPLIARSAQVQPLAQLLTLVISCLPMPLLLVPILMLLPAQLPLSQLLAQREC
jgi:hypothetical protein